MLKEEKLLQHNPLSDADVILRDDFYGRRSSAADSDIAETITPATRRMAHGTQRMPRVTEKPTHYKVICISMYTKDIEELDSKVNELKRRGWTKANKSQLIRLALSQLDLDRLPTPQQ